MTHAVIGALAVRVPRPGYYAGSGLSERVRLTAVALASAFPDMDYAGFLVDPYRFITEWHRGISHSLLLLPLWAGLLGLLLSVAAGRSALRMELIRLCGLGLLLHILFDLITVYGTRIFAPWSDTRIALDLTYDADLWIAAIASLSLLLSFYRRVFARVGMLFLGLYLGLTLIAQSAAIRIGENLRTVSVQKIHAIPHPLSPFHRILVIETSSGYRLALLDLSGLRDILSVLDPSDRSGLGRYRNKETLQWRWRRKPGIPGPGREIVHAAWRHEDMKRFRRFAVLPVVYRIDRERYPVCVWFTDLRYMIPRIIPPFRYGMCRNGPDSEWHGYRLKQFTQSERETIESSQGLKP
ncbi:MAG: metal-dependent hydrolase [Methylococcaceae bacterium]|nr:metal-dependent hydrolase [Methylococcaceae bacterium]